MGSKTTIPFYTVPNVSFSLKCDTLRVSGYGLEWSETTLLNKKNLWLDKKTLAMVFPGVKATTRPGC